MIDKIKLYEKKNSIYNFALISSYKIHRRIDYNIMIKYHSEDPDLI